MLFTTLEFLLLFLPLCVVVAFVTRRVSQRSAVFVGLIVLNLLFYAWFRTDYVLLLSGSIVFNYWVGQRLIKQPRTPLLAAAIAINLAVLGYFKYALFFATTLGFDHPALRNIVLPLAISFYTFQQISFLVDCRQGNIKEVALAKYAVYVSFFPQLIAGPIVRFSQLYPQLDQLFKPSRIQFAVGLTLFVFGLAKKTLIADVLAKPVDAVWDALSTPDSVSSVDAWSAMFAYSFQIYFDFSAYSDMAIGLGLMMGVVLPVNFLSPYRSGSIREFWQRWHITLSQWLRDYLYIPLGGNRAGRSRQLLAIAVTMILGGLWHGAGWNFVLWGCAHGIWIALSHLLGSKSTRSTHWLRHFLSVFATFMGVSLLWVLFRGEHGTWTSMVAHLVQFTAPPTSDALFNFHEIVTLAIAALVAFALPSNAALFGLDTDTEATWLRFKPNLFFALATCVLFALAIVFIIEGEPNAFIYFQF